MRMYNYATMDGPTIAKEGIIYPTKLVDARSCPAVIFVTSQEDYIPDETLLSWWRFTVEVKEPLVKIIYNNPQWIQLVCKTELDLTKLHWVTRPLPVIETYALNRKSWILKE